MRVISKKNKGSFVIFSVAIAIVVAIVVFMFIQQVQAATVKEYDVPINSVVYDKNGDYIDVSAAGTIKRLWNDDYRITLGNGNSYEAGKHSVIRSGSILSVYGGGYKVYEDGTVKTLPKAATITNLATSDFYKIDDRKYLMVGSDIRVENSDIQLSGYVYVELDKAGNAFLRNDKVNIKVVAPVTLSTDNMVFDGSNEVLTTGGVVTDLKKINGSTSEYQKVSDLNIRDQDATSNDGGNATGNGSNNAGTTGEGGTGGSGTGNGGSGNAATNGTSGSGNTVLVKGAEELKSTINKIVDVINNSNNSNGSGSSQPTQVSSLVLNSVNVGVNSMNVDYIVRDSADRYASVFLEVTPSASSDAKDTQTLQLGKSETRREVYGLYPNKTYTVSLGYIDKSGTKHTVDTSSVRTNNITGDLSVTRVVGDRIYFTLKLSSEFKLDSGNLVVYSDDARDASLAIDTTAAASASGWSSSIKVNATSARSYLLKLENMLYEENGIQNEIDLKVETTIKNTWFNKIVRSLFG